MSDSVSLQLKQFSKAVEKSRLVQLQSTSKIPSELSTISQDLQELMDLPQTVLKSIKSNAFEVAIELISYFNQVIVVKLKDVPFIEYLKEEVAKLTDTLKDNIKESINSRISFKSTFGLILLLKQLMPSANNLDLAEEYVKLRDSRFGIIFNKALFSLVQKLPSDFADFSTADQQKSLSAYIHSIEELPEVLMEVKELREVWAREDLGWRVEKLLDAWTKGHVKNFVVIARSAIRSAEDKDAVERIYKIAEKLKEQINLIPLMESFCEEYVKEFTEERLREVKEGLVKEIKRGIRQKQIDTKEIVSDVPEEISTNSTYLLFIGHASSDLKRIL